MSVAATDAVLPNSFWTYLGFQIPASQVDELRIAFQHPGQRYDAWRLDRYGTGSHVVFRRDDESCRVEISTTGRLVHCTDTDKNVCFCLQTGRIVAINRYSYIHRDVLQIHRMLQRAMLRFQSRRQRCIAGIRALDKYRRLPADMYSLVLSFYK